MEQKQKNKTKSFTNKLAKQNGVTLIALVVTIVILIILAAVSIQMIIGDNGIIAQAQKAAKDTAKAEEETQKGLNSLADEIAGYIGTTNKAYTTGEEVTVGGESFYVLEASDASKSEVTLLSKYNLNTAGTQQQNAGYATTACAFSSTNYWQAETTYPLNLNNYPGYQATDAIGKAKAYAEAKGGTEGRLLTYEEANSLKGTYGNMIWGKAASDGYLYYWLGSAGSTISVWDADGITEFCNRDSFDLADYFGVRPVLTVSKSLIS